MTALNSFDQVGQICDFLLRPDVSDTHPLHYPLMIALHTLYGRPFKQRPPMRLSPEIVPSQYQELHESLLVMRDKIFAHVDYDGVKTDENALLNKVIVSVTAHGAKPAVSYLMPRDIRLKKVKELAAALVKKTSYHAHKIWDRHMHGERLPLGAYEINLGSLSEDFLVPLKF